MRTANIFLAALVLALAGCATVAPPGDSPPKPAIAPAAATEPAPAPSLADVVIGPPVVELAPIASINIPQVVPFDPEAAAQLEELPAPAQDLWDRIKGRFQLPEIAGPDVAKWEQWYAARPDYVARMIERSRRYLYYVVVEVESRGMPAEIALLPMVESAYNPNAMSRSSASGMWQFIPSTGTLYGLKQNFWFDSRRDVIAATTSALAYLDKLHAQFDDWQLALAAYNCGEGNVARAVERNRRAGRASDYASLVLPDETRNYLPKLQAVKNIIRDPGKYGLALADIPDAPYFAVVRTSKEMDVKRAAELAEMSVDEFRYLNPHHNRPVIAGADQYTLLLPIDKAELFAAKLDLIDQPLVSWQAYRMRPGDTLQQVAARYGMTLETLRAVNGIGVRSTVPTGYSLLVPSQRGSREAASSFDHAVFTTVPIGRTFYYRVTRGDTMKKIASRYDVSAEDIRRWNGLAQDNVRPGQKLRITSDRAPAIAKTKVASGRAPKAHAGRAAPTTKPSEGGKARIIRVDVKDVRKTGASVPGAKGTKSHGSRHRNAKTT